MEPFIESNMQFGPYPEGNCFRVETSDTYRAIQEGVPIAELLLLHASDDSAPCVWVVEAKGSSPRPETQPNFSIFIGEIRDKLANALALGIAAMLMRHPKYAAELPDPFKALDLSVIRFKLVLIVKGHRKSWLPPIHDALRKALQVTTKTWALGGNAVVVLNEELALSYGLIANVAQTDGRAPDVL